MDSVTVDNRLLTESGRAQIIQQQKDLPQNAEIIGKMTAAGVTSLGVATASLASGDQNLKQAYDTVMNPARTFDFVQKHPEAATVLEQFKNGDYDGLLATKGSIQLLAQALGQDVNVLTTSITSFLNIKGAYDHQTDTVVLDVNNENRSSILNTTGHEIAHGQGIKNETSADLVGKSVDWAFNSGIKNNQDTIDQFKGQLGDGKDASTQLKNNEILTNDNHKAIDSIADHSDVIDEKTTLNQDKDLIIALAGCAKNFSLDCASSKYTDYKTLDGIQSLAYQRGYDKAVDQMIADAKNLPKNVHEALILIKDDPKAFGAAMLQALKDMPAEYQDKAKKVLAAKYNAKTPAEFEAAGKAELELKVEMGSFMLGGVGAVKTGAKVGAEIAEKISAKAAEKAPKVLTVCSNGVCFVSGTLIETDQGLKEVERFIGGELVWSRNDRTLEYGYRPVIATKETADQTIFEIVIQNQQGQQEKLETTAEHPFWVKNFGWLKSSLLQSGMILLDRNNEELTVVNQVLIPNKVETVYNIEVDGFHTYHVGELGTWVHNANCCDILSQLMPLYQ